MRRFAVLIGINLGIMLTLSILAHVLGLNKYLTAGGAMNWTALAVASLFWGFAGSFFSLAISKFIAKKTMGVELIDASGNGPLDRQTNLWLYREVEQLALKAGIAMPEVGVYSGDPNAFATGPSRNNSLVAVSTGLLNQLNSQEVVAVLAHEVGHIKNGDMVTMTLAQGCMNAFTLFLSRAIAWAATTALASRSEDSQFSHGTYSLIAFVLDLLFSVLGALVLAAYSRHREFRADEASARLYGTSPMIAALQRLHSSTPAEMPASMKAFGISSKGSVLELFSTHPSMERRVEALKALR